MGYYTDFQVAVDDASISQELDEILREFSDYSFNNGSAQGVKWYRWKEDMKRVSLKYPLAIFTVEGEGEEAGDLWKAYFLGGQMQLAKAQITYEAFDAEKLK